MMKITEAQIHKLIHYLTALSATSEMKLTAEGRLNVVDLLSEIVKQQSSEVKDVE